MSQLPTVIWGAGQWLIPAAAVTLLLFGLVAWGYRKVSAPPAIRGLAAGLKLFGVLILALCLLDPLLSSQRARPGANQFVILADNSQSMTLTDRDSQTSRGTQLRSILDKTSPWLLQLAEDFDLRQYSFDTQLSPLAGSGSLSLDGAASNLGSSLHRLVGRYHGRPLAGMLLFTDGNPTDREALERLLAQASSSDSTQKLPPIYPVLIGGQQPAADINLDDISITQTNFEDAPVTLAAQITASGYRGQSVVVELTDQAGTSLEQQKITIEQDGHPQIVRFRMKPLETGVSFYRVKVAADAAGLKPADQSDNRGEATLANNSRLVAVDRGQGPYRVLYVTGRPNWEYKFLNRAIAGDSQVQLVGMLRIAKREPKFNYLGHLGEQSNPLFRGFGPENPAAVEQYDQPVLIRIGTTDAEELRSGFPQTAAELYRYHALVLDDLESEFFTQDQMLLIKEFVRQRGGGLLMLGGQESFKNGKYDRTPIGDLLPVYVDQVPTPPANAQMRMALTREGWLEPWVRLRPEEVGEESRLGSMPPFQTINTVRGIKPGATVLARAQVDGGESLPALVEQRFGRGRSAALLIGDLWRWGMHRPENAPSDMEKAWRQTIRWLVAEVPKRVEVALEKPQDEEDVDGATRLDVRVRDEAFAPLDNAGVTIKITTPDGKSVDLTAEASSREAGLYEAIYVPRQAGAYRAEVKAAGTDGSEVGATEAGWSSEPAADEFRVLKPDRDLLARIAKVTGGETVDAANLASFVASLPTRHAEITEPYIRPLWHTPWVFLLAIACLTAEWGLRRWKGLP